MRHVLYKLRTMTTTIKKSDPEMQLGKAIPELSTWALLILGVWPGTSAIVGAHVILASPLHSLETDGRRLKTSGRNNGLLST